MSCDDARLHLVHEPYVGGCWAASAAMALAAIGDPRDANDLVAEARAEGWLDDAGRLDGDALAALLSRHGVRLTWTEGAPERLYDVLGEALDASPIALVVHATRATGPAHVSVAARAPEAGEVRWLDPRLGEAVVPRLSMRGPTPGSALVAVGALYCSSQAS